MKKFDRVHWVKIGILVVYAAIILAVYVLLYVNNIPLRTIPRLVGHVIQGAGAWGPLALLGFATASSIIPFPSAGVSVISGVLFGPWLGSVLAVLGLNIAASISFWLGRYFGRHFVSEHEKGWVKKYDDLLSEQGFISVIAMRLLFFPFDIVSIGSGLTRMPYRQFVAGSLLGSIPHTVSFVVLGESLSSPRTWGMFTFLIILSLFGAFFLQRSAWAKKNIFVEPAKSPEDFEKDV